VPMRLSPAAYVIRVMHGVRATARVVGCYPSTVYKWLWPLEKRGCGGEIPRLARRAILIYAKAHGLDINATDLEEGRVVDEVGGEVA